MKKIAALFIFILLFSSCKSDKKEILHPVSDASQLSPAEKIANAYGFSNWEKISQIAFTFNVDRDRKKVGGNVLLIRRIHANI